MKQKFWSLVILASLIFPGTLGILQAAQGADGVSVHLLIQGITDTIFDSDVNVTNCVITDNQDTPHQLDSVAACALDEAAKQKSFSYDFGYKEEWGGLFLNNIANETMPTGSWWGFWVNNEMSWVGLSSYAVQNNDLIKLSLVLPDPSPSPSIDPSPSTSPTPTPSATATPTPTPTATPTATPTPTPTPVDIVSSDTRHEAANKALQYLKNHQDDNGKIDGDTATAWSVIAFGANSQSSANIIHNNNSLLAALTNTSLPLATDIERQILAIRASGANPRSFNGHDYVADLRGKYGHNQIGEEDLINDDIFGVLALIAGGESTDSAAVNNTVTTIINKQSSDGSWTGGIDMTAAGIQALRAYKAYSGDTNINDAVSKAREYLKSHQDSRGGFGNNSATTAWTIQAIASLGEDPNNWSTDNNKTPFSALLEYQNSNGSFGWQGKDDTSALMTAYAVPALLKAPLPITKLSEATSSETETLTYTTAQTVIIKTSPTTKPTIKATPKVAGAVSYQEVLPRPKDFVISQNTDTTPTPIPSTNPTITPQTAPSGFVPINTNDRNFVFSIFGLANMGIGVTITRLLSKLFI